MTLPSSDLAELRTARSLLERPSIAVRLTDLIGRPIEFSVRHLPEKVTATIHSMTQRSLEHALDVAVKTMRAERSGSSADSLHKMVTAAAGAAGGMFGLAGLAVELPVTTVLMLRSVGDIARSEGHDLSAPETRLDCLEVFAFGGRSSGDDASETGYYAVRGALAKAVSDAARHVAEKGMISRGAPALVRLIEKVAARFGIVVQEKVVLEMVPVIGAVSGALINTLFLDHFQNTARGHFIIRRLEGTHGADLVREAYEKLGPTR